MSDNFGKLMSEASGGDFRALGRLLTWLERSGPKASFEVDGIANPTHQAFRLGITGPPGAGKSTLVGQLIGLLRAQGLKVAVLAVPPLVKVAEYAVDITFT